jgi:hypothetical protein
MTTLAEWILSFRALHEKARRGKLLDAEAARYRSARDELGRALLVGQRLQIKPGETPRRALRISRALQVELELGAGPQRAITIDFSTGGFSCLLPRAPALGEEIGFTLRLPLTDPIAGRAGVREVKPLTAGNVRVSFTFKTISDADRDRVELFVFDVVLTQLAPG